MTQPNRHIIDDLVAILVQGRDLIADISDDAYCQSPCQIKASSLGAHYRHHLEHVQLFVQGALQHGQIDYDQRARDMTLETSRKAAIEKTNVFIQILEDLPTESLNAPIEVGHRTCITQEHAYLCQSSVARELLFLLSHAIHHYALMKVIAEDVSPVTCQKGFGVMPSTLMHEKAVAS